MIEHSLLSPRCITAVTYLLALCNLVYVSLNNTKYTPDSVRRHILFSQLAILPCSPLSSASWDPLFHLKLLHPDLWYVYIVQWWSLPSFYPQQSAGSGEGLAPLVNFYSKLPKGPAPAPVGGIKARFFTGKNASAAPAVWVILGLFTLGYTIDYQSSYYFILFLKILTELSHPVHLSEYNQSLIGVT